MRYRWLLALVVVAGLVGALPASPMQAVGDTRCFPETGFCILGSFRQFWERNGGLRIFGFPISEQFTTNFQGRTLTAQYFERARFELYPTERTGILLGRVGEELLSQRGVDWRTFPTTYDPNRRDCRAFNETRHAVCGGFLTYFNGNGGLRIFGLPLSDEFQERLPDGRVATFQWFERARMEFYPNNLPQSQIQLGLLGGELLGR